MIKKRSIQVFGKENGKTTTFRIPSIIMTAKGTLITCVDERFYTAKDNPNRISKIVKRSVDNGKTWSERITALGSIGNSTRKATAAMDPSLLYDYETDTIHLIYLFTPGGIGILNTRKFIGMEEGNYIVRKGRVKYLLKNNELYLKGKATGIKVDNKGYINKSENIYDGTSSFKLEQTTYLMLSSSKDDGLTWSAPICLNEQVKQKNWSLIGPGPGCGIQVSKGKYKGRLIFPIYYSWIANLTHMESAMIYSDDNAKTWHLGESPSMPFKKKIFNTKLMCLRARTTESQIVELDDGSLKLFMRNHHLRRHIATSKSYDGGKTWSKGEYHETLIHPVSQFAAISFYHEGKHMIATVNPASKKKRINGTIRLSENGGETFPFSLQLTENHFPEGYFGYSSLVFLENEKSIGIFYEPSELFDSMNFAKYTIEEIKFKDL